MSEVAIYKGPYLGDDRLYVRLDAYNDVVAENAALQQKLDALAAEREKFAVECAAAKIAIQYANNAGFKCLLNTPDINAYLNSVRAEGVEMFAARLRSDATELSVCKMIALGADDFAAQLRSQEAK
ncbi:hypothetical protein [Pantoea latae]|uniref:Uncharacterized protein n=1 Tax=Pantoea latae TaxID=1964541 RepID=A0A1V9DJ63_9GAMM|nr:hypothetical protein [Pantoea latae]OQP33888.1 hypothetical protein B2J69_09925 [Pantoea latae]